VRFARPYIREGDIVMEKHPMIDFMVQLVRTYQKRRVSCSAAEFAYFLTLSIFPLLICVIAILGQFEINLSGLLGDIWAADVLEAVFDYVEHVGNVPSAFIIVTSITIIVTSGSAAFRAVEKSMAEIQGCPRYTGIWGFLFSLAFSLVLLFTIYFSVLMITTGGWLMEMVEDWAGIYGLALFWSRIRFLLLFVVGVVVVHFLYLFTAPKEPKLRRLPGAVLATLALVLGSMLFSFFMGASARYPLIYGSLASFILLMVWAYLCGHILIVGNLFNYTLYQRKHLANGADLCDNEE